jgi:6-pyruvoyltetrahydropterin/6-carboxytetrahydropterin synthase
MVRLGRRYRFSASHRLHSASLTDEQNAAVYGKCNNPYGHGHDYILEVVLRGEPRPESGLLIGVGELDDLVRRAVLRDYDQKYMNAEIERFATVPPTTEYVAEDIYQRLERAWPEEWPPLDSVKILETKRNTVEYRGIR